VANDDCCFVGHGAAGKGCGICSDPSLSFGRRTPFLSDSDREMVDTGHVLRYAQGALAKRTTRSRGGWFYAPDSVSSIVAPQVSRSPFASR